MKHITSRFVTLLALAAIVPLLSYGFVSISSLREGIRQSVVAGNKNVAKRAAEQIQLYITSDIKILRSVGADLESTNLEPSQRDRILKNYVLEFPEFREITLFDAAGLPISSSRVGAPQLVPPTAGSPQGGDVTMSSIRLDDDSLPTTDVGIRLMHVGRSAGSLSGQINLEELWRMVDSIRVGKTGFAQLVASDGRLIAHGDPDKKPLVAQGENLKDHPLVRQIRDRQDAGPVSDEYVSKDGRSVLGVAAGIAAVAGANQAGWVVIVEQPMDEAYEVTKQMERQLLTWIAVALLAMLGAGYYWGTSFIRPIFTLIRGTRAVAEGRLDERVDIPGRDEFHQLGVAFNSMADRLVELQEDVRKKERQAMFGRIAVGLVHDLSHPIQNIGNSCKLILKMFDDLDYRETFKRTVDREFGSIKRVLEDLRNVARPIPLERFPVDVNRSMAEVVEAMRSAADEAGLTLNLQLARNAPFIEGDVFALGRVYRNLILNAVQATAPGGRVTVVTEQRDGVVEIRVADSGCGIPPERLGAIFEDFVTTKRRGLGLGLAISKKIVEQLGGTITVASDVGKGTTFVLHFPVMVGHVALAAAAV